MIRYIYMTLAVIGIALTCVSYAVEELWRIVVLGLAVSAQLGVIALVSYERMNIAKEFLRKRALPLDVLKGEFK